MKARVEHRIIEYLRDYGNTREDDVISHFARKSGHPRERIKSAIRNMVIKGWIFYVVHNSLRPPQVYLTVKEALPSKIPFHRSPHASLDVEAQRILKEAAAVAERRSKGNEI